MRFVLHALLFVALLWFSGAQAAQLGKCASAFLPETVITGKFRGAIQAMSEAELLARVNAPSKTARDIKIEIGPLNRPMCEDCISLDLFKEGLQWVRGPKLVANATHLPFRDESVDRIVLRDFPVIVTAGFPIEFLGDLMREFRRVLKENGEVYLVTTRTPPGSKHFVYLANPLAENGVDILFSKDVLSPEALFEVQYLHQAKAAESAGLHLTPFTADWMEGFILRSNPLVPSGF